MMTYSNLADMRTGVIGVGSMGQNHARVFHEISNLQAISDMDEKQGNEIADRFGVNYFKNYEEMLDQLDAVSIAVPTVYHREVAETVAKAGVNFLVEKPLSHTSEDAEAIILAAEKAKVVMAVGQIERHNSIVSLAKNKLNGGEWGKIISLSAKRFSNYPGRISDVGVLFDLTIHDVDILRYFVDSEVSHVFTTGGKFNNKYHEDFVNLSLIFENGSIGLCETNWLTPMKVRNLEITTDKAYINLNHIKQEIKVLSSKFGEVDDSNLFQPPIEVEEKLFTPKVQEPLKNELVDFLSAIYHSREPLVSGREGLASVKIVEAGLRSLNTNSRIAL